MTSTSIPASMETRSTKSEEFFASRTALVATAKTLARWASAILRMLRRALIPRSIASGLNIFMSPPPSPRRVLSFSRAMTSKPESLTFATTIWMLLVPMSIAAMMRGEMLIL